MTTAPSPSTPKLPRPGSLGAWVLASRPATLPVAVAPVAVGVACARAAGLPIDARAALAALLGAVWIQIGTNFANDVFDFEKGADDATRIGPTRAVQAGLLAPAAVRRGMFVSFALATLFGAYLVGSSGWPIVAIGVASIVSGIAYTGGPYPLGYNGLGDVFVFGFFGLVAVTGTAFVATGQVPTIAWIASVPVGALATAVLVVNNVRDYQGDVRVGKRTLVARFGRRFGELEYLAMVLLGAGVPIGLAVLGLASRWTALAALPLPFGLSLFRTLCASTDGPTLNRCLASTAKLMLATSALLAIGLALGGP